MEVKNLVDTKLDVAIPNLVMNGDFSNGTTGWGGEANISSVSAVDGKLRTTRIGEKTHFRCGQNNLTLVSGRKYYTKVTYKQSELSDPGHRAFVGVRVSTYVSNSVAVLLYFKNITDEQTLSSVVQVPDTGQSIAIVGYTPSIDSYFDTDNILIIDLTNIFGAGNEPTKAEMDTLIDIVGWWDGELTLTQKQQLIWTLNLIRANTLAIAGL